MNKTKRRMIRGQHQPLKWLVEEEEEWSLSVINTEYYCLTSLPLCQLANHFNKFSMKIFFHSFSPLPGPRPIGVAEIEVSKRTKIESIPVVRTLCIIVSLTISCTSYTLWVDPEKLTRIRLLQPMINRIWYLVFTRNDDSKINRNYPNRNRNLPEIEFTRYNLIAGLTLTK